MLGLIATMLAKAGLDLLAGTIKAGGEKAVQLIEEKTGIDIKDIANPETESTLTPDHIVKLKQFETSEVINLAKIVAFADADKASGIIVAAIAPDIPELILFGLAVTLISIFAIAEITVLKTLDISSNLASLWLGAFAMYVKGK